MTSEPPGRGDQRTPSDDGSVTDRIQFESHPRIAGRRVTDVSALLGAGCWLALRGAVTLGAVSVTLVEQFVALALLVLVPLGLGVAVAPTDRDETVVQPSIGRGLPYRIAVLAQLPAALAATASLTVPVASSAGVVLALPWLGVTAVVASLGLWRLASRGPWPVSELAIDAGMLYLPVGAVALLSHRAGISLSFRPIIVLLTAVHYHYAGFVLPLVTGRIARLLAARGHLPSNVLGRATDPSGRATDPSGRGTDVLDRATAVAIFLIVGNVALIAVGITFSPIVEVVAVALFTTAVVVLALVTLLRVVPAIDRRQGVPLAVALCTLFWTMALAMAYGYSAFPGTGRLVTIGQLVTWHGSFNALGFALPALLAFRLRDAS